MTGKGVEQIMPQDDHGEDRSQTLSGIEAVAIIGSRGNRD